ncbi:SigE family RNA polymerase sigma factor [Saccharothrix sp. Mg75]|uniref:SigE family RNA polymerase sigma factor n=1 Tax=Saccharothrix sp. Mg75 TaxID=3445357 RepID=UPI003EF06341
MTDGEFEEYARADGPLLRRGAYRLCGDRHRADDLAQTALLKVHHVRSRLGPDVRVHAYARRVLLHVVVDEARRAGRRRETAVAEVPAVADRSPDTDAVLDVRAALVRLPPRQRAVVVLRYCHDLSLADTARALGCTEGTVKSQAAKGLAALRALLSPSPAA